MSKAIEGLKEILKGANKRVFNKDFTSMIVNALCTVAACTAVGAGLGTLTAFGMLLPGSVLAGGLASGAFIGAGVGLGVYGAASLIVTYGDMYAVGNAKEKLGFLIGGLAIAATCVFGAYKLFGVGLDEKAKLQDKNLGYIEETKNDCLQRNIYIEKRGDDVLVSLPSKCLVPVEEHYSLTDNFQSKCKDATIKINTGEDDEPESVTCTFLKSPASLGFR